MADATVAQSPNAEQAAAWNGEEGIVWAEHADRYDRASARHWRRLLAADLVRSGDAVLDVGCGTGMSSRDLARIAGDGTVTGVDLSAPMLDLARSRAEAAGLDNAHFIQGDVQIHPFLAGSYDLAVSSFGAMFFDDPVAAFTNIGRSLGPDGRLAVLAWRDLDQNDWLLTVRDAFAMGRELPVPPPDAASPFSLADPVRVHALLGSAGFGDIELEPVDEPIDFGPTADEADRFVHTFGIVRGLCHGLSAEQRAEAFGNLRARIDARVGPDGVLFGSAAWLITARAGRSE